MPWLKHPEFCCLLSRKVLLFLPFSIHLCYLCLLCRFFFLVGKSEDEKCLLCTHSQTILIVTYIHITLYSLNLFFSLSFLFFCDFFILFLFIFVIADAVARHLFILSFHDSNTDFHLSKSFHRPSEYLIYRFCEFSSCALWEFTSLFLALLCFISFSLSFRAWMSSCAYPHNANARINNNGNDIIYGKVTNS